MKIKKIVPFFSLLVVAVLLATACGSKPEEVPTLNVWITWGDNPAQLQALFDRYGEANGVKVVVNAPVEVDQILPALTGSEPPDVLILSGGDLVKSYAAEGLVMELSDAIAAGGVDLNDIFPASLDQCKVGGEVWCLPWGADIYALFWNKDAFEAAGLDPEQPPQTLEQLVEYADLLTTVAADGTIEQIGFIPDQAWGHSDLYVRMFGGFWYSEDGTQLTANSQPMIDMLLWQQQFYTKYGYDEVLAFSTGFGDQYMSPDYPFYTGKLAMYVDGEWQTGPNFISALKPELNYGVAPFPYPADSPERANTSVLQGTVAAIPANVKDPEASAKLLAWIMSPEIVAEEMCVNANLPTSKIAAQDPCFTENPKFAVFMDLMADPNSYYVITTPISLQFNDAFALVEEQVLHTGADPVPLLDQLQADLATQLEEALNK